MLTLQNLTVKHLYGATAIADFSLEIGHQERIAVLAESEGGKTSLLRALAGLVPTTGGSVCLNNKDITHQKPKERNCAFVMDDLGIFGWKNVAYNLEYPLKVRKVPKKERQDQVLALLRQHDMEHLFADYGRQLSSEERVEVALLRTQVRGADYYLLDNPFAQVKSESARKKLFLKWLPTLKNYQAPTLFATNSLEEALSFGDRVVVLSYGVVEQVGTAEDILLAPSTLSVAKLTQSGANHKEAFAKDGVLTLSRYQIPTTLPNGEYWATYCLCEHEDGILQPVACTFYQNDVLFARLETGEMVPIKNPKQSEVKVRVKEQTLHIFSHKQEKRLTL